MGTKHIRVREGALMKRSAFAHAATLQNRLEFREQHWIEFSIWHLCLEEHDLAQCEFRGDECKDEALQRCCGQILGADRR